MFLNIFLTIIGMDSLASSINTVVSNSLDFSCLGFYIFMWLRTDTECRLAEKYGTSSVLKVVVYSLCLEEFHMRKINRPVSSVYPGIFRVGQHSELNSKAATIWKFSAYVIK